MSNVTDYVGKTIDLAAFQGWAPAFGIEVLLDQAIASEESPSGEVVTGVIKLVQRFLIMLLTEQGSMPYLPLIGCRFMVDARQGRWRTAADVNQSFYFSLLDIKRQMKALESASDPPEERFQTARVLGIVLSPADKATMRLAIVTAAGTKRAVILPINTTIQ